MKRFQMSLRTKVVLSLTFLMASAMLLIGVVMLKLSQRDLIQAKVEQGLLLKSSLARLIRTEPASSRSKLEFVHDSQLLPSLTAEAQEIAGTWQITLTDRSGRVIHASDINKKRKPQRLPELQRVMRLGVDNISFTPSSLPFSWLLPEKIVLDSPLFSNAKIMGAVRLETSLADVRRSLWRSQKLLLFYIVLDILVLVAFGTYLFSKLVVRPVEHLVRTAEGFQEGDRLPDLSEEEQNELSKLAQALNAMLQRLAENKEELKQHIISLEQANLELKRAQQEVIFSEKMASVGRLTAGIAHEIGNPIGIVLGYLELLQREDIGDEERQELIRRMGREIQRIHQIIRQLLDFARPTSTDRQRISVHPLVQETLAVLEHQYRTQEVEVCLDLNANPDTVLANADQLKQVFFNLMVNAADAMAATDERAQGGQLRVSTKSLTLGIRATENGQEQPLRRRTDPLAADYRHLRRAHATGDNRWIEIQFADTGVGVAEEDREKVFDPFFTTKEVGKGTGLGLSVSIQIIQTLGGRMELSSSPGEETTVSIFLPLFDEETEKLTTNSAQPVTDRRH